MRKSINISRTALMVLLPLFYDADLQVKISNSSRKAFHI
ncbi:hypothetical protein M2347_000436 [Chryseobacterium sp. H1D6B]|nr:hypothetical protein [Chryseobacterium sp. H1D6B]